jgi:hypothetical protein
VEAEMDEIVSRVDNGRHRSFWKSVGEAVEEARTPDAAGKGNDVHA